MNRRRFLERTAGVVALLGAHRRTADPGPPDESEQDLSGESERDLSDESERNSPEAPEETVRYADAFETVVYAPDVGVVPGGDVPINRFIERYAADDTLLSFPAGTYRLRPATLSGVSRLGIAAAGSEPMTIEPIDAECEPGDPYLQFEAIDGFLLDGIDFDLRRRDAGGEIQLFARGNTVLRRVRIAGSCPDQIATFRVDVHDSDDEALIENLVAHNTADNPRLTGVYVGRRHAGSITFRECELEGYSDNGLYASSPGLPGGRDGVVHVVGGTFRNNNVANVRLGSTGSTVRNSTVIVDSVPPSAGSLNARGIRLRERDDLLVEDCKISIEQDAGYSFGAIVVHPAAGGAIVRDTEIAVDRGSIPAVRAFDRLSNTDSPLMFDNLTIDGSAAGGFAASIRGRDGTVFRNCTITQTGADRGGIRLRDAGECHIIDSHIDVTGTPLTVRNGEIWIRNCTFATSERSATVEKLRIRNDGR